MSIQGAINSLVGTMSNVKMAKDLVDKTTGQQGVLQPEVNKSDLASQEAYKHMMEKVFLYDQNGEVIR